MSVAEVFMGVELGALPSTPSGQLRLVAPWQQDVGERRDVASELDLDAAWLASFDIRAAAAALHEVLREWRATDRALGAVAPWSLDRPVLEARVDALRAIHHRLFTDIRRAERLSPRPESTDLDW